MSYGNSFTMLGVAMTQMLYVNPTPVNPGPEFVHVHHTFIVKKWIYSNITIKLIWNLNQTQSISVLLSLMKKISKTFPGAKHKTQGNRDVLTK